MALNEVVAGMLSLFVLEAVVPARHKVPGMVRRLIPQGTKALGPDGWLTGTILGLIAAPAIVSAAAGLANYVLHPVPDANARSTLDVLTQMATTSTPGIQRCLWLLLSSGSTYLHDAPCQASSGLFAIRAGRIIQPPFTPHVQRCFALWWRKSSFVVSCCHRSQSTCLCRWQLPFHPWHLGWCTAHRMSCHRCVGIQTLASLNTCFDSLVIDDLTVSSSICDS